MSFESLGDGHLSNYSSAVAGLGSTAVANFAVYPFDVIRTRLIVQTLKPKKRRMLCTFKNVVRNEGLLALYRGLLPSIFGRDIEVFHKLWSVSQTDMSLFYRLTVSH